MTVSTPTRPSTTTTHKAPARSSNLSVSRTDGFAVTTTDRSVDYNRPQKMGRKLWRPMFALGLMGWAVGIVLAIVQAGTDRTDTGTLQTLSHLVPAFMFIGFLGVFSAIIFAIARILGEFRKGGGEVQAATNNGVQTLKMPKTARAMMMFMMVGMVTLAAAVITNFVGAGFDAGSASEMLDSRQYAKVASGLRRIGTVSYLTGIAFGLATIVEVLRFQAIRIRELVPGGGRND